MLKKQMTKYIEKNLKDGAKLELFKEEKEYLLKHDMIPDDKAVEIDSNSRFSDAYIERVDKETEELIAEETSNFLTQQINYFKGQKNEFMYLESEWFELIGVDAVSFEVDDVFGTYSVMLGLKLQKKYKISIENQLNCHLHVEKPSFELMFSNEDGLWNLNFSLNDVESFNEEMTIAEAYQSIYRVLFKVVEGVEVDK